MKYLALFIPFLSFGQVKVVKKTDLPAYVKHDTIVVKDVWIKDVKEEAKDRKKILVLEKKITRITNILHEKRNINKSIDSLLIEVEEITNQRDSLQRFIDNDIKEETSKILGRLKDLNNRIAWLNNKIKKEKSRNRKTKKRLITVVGVAIIEGVIIILLI